MAISREGFNPKTLKNIHFAIIFFAAIVLCIFALSMKSSALTVNVSNETQFANAVASINNSNDPTHTINITNNITLTSHYQIHKPCTIKSSTGTQYTVTLNREIFSRFSKLTFVNLKFVGASSTNINAVGLSFTNCDTQNNNIRVSSEYGDVLISSGTHNEIYVQSCNMDIINSHVNYISHIGDDIINVTGSSTINRMATYNNLTINYNTTGDFYSTKFELSGFFNSQTVQLNLNGATKLKASLIDSDAYDEWAPRYNINVNNSSVLWLLNGYTSFGTLNFSSTAAANLIFDVNYFDKFGTVPYKLAGGIYGNVNARIDCSVSTLKSFFTLIDPKAAQSSVINVTNHSGNLYAIWGFGGIVYM